MVQDLVVLPKDWMYFYNHNLDTNHNGYELTSHLMNIGQFIVSNMDDIAHSNTKNALGHA